MRPDFGHFHFVDANFLGEKSYHDWCLSILLLAFKNDMNFCARIFFCNLFFHTRLDDLKDFFCHFYLVKWNIPWNRCRRDVIKIFTVYSSLSTQQVCMCTFCYRKRPHFCHFAYITIDYQCVYVTLNFIALRKKIKMLCEHANKKLLSQE